LTLLRFCVCIPVRCRAQAAEAAEASAVNAAVEADLAATLATADALTLRARGVAALHVFFGAPWFVTRAHRRLPGAPPTTRGATLTPLPAAPALALFGGVPASASGAAFPAATPRGFAAPSPRGGHGGASAAYDDGDDNDDEGGAAARCGDAYSLSLATFTWSRAAAAAPPPHGEAAGAGGATTPAAGATAAALDALSHTFSPLPQPPPLSRRGAGRVGHAAAAYFPAPDAAGAPGGVVALLGGATSSAPGSALCGADVALLAAAADGALRWLAPGAAVGARSGTNNAFAAPSAPVRFGAATAASPCGRFLHVFGGADASGELCADMSCLDLAAPAWVAHSSTSATATPASRQRSPGSPGRRGTAAATPSSPGGRRGALGGGGAGVASATPMLNAGAAGWGTPRPRTGGALAASPDGRTLWLFGGTLVGGTTVNELYSYDIERGTWAPREWGAGGACPGPRAGAALAVEGRYLLLAGGTAGVPPAGGAPAGAGGAHPAALRDAWALDTERLHWECLLRHEDDANGGDAAAAPGGVALAAWRGRTLCMLRGGPRGKLDLLETTEFAFPDDIDALITSATAAKRAAARALAASAGADAPADDDDDASGNGNFGRGGAGGGTLRGSLRGTMTGGHAAVPAVSAAAALRLYVLAARGASWLDLAWRPPARHAERVAGYKLMLAPAGAATVRCVYSGPATHARVGGLRPSTEYICVVKASYDDGEHVWSDTEAFCTAAKAPGTAAGRARSPSGGGGGVARARTAAPAVRGVRQTSPPPRPSSPPVAARGGSPGARRPGTATSGGGGSSRGSAGAGGLALPSLPPRTPLTAAPPAAAMAADSMSPPPAAAAAAAPPPPPPFTARGAPPPLQLPADADASFASFGDEGGPVTSVAGGALTSRSRPGTAGSFMAVDEMADDATAAWDAGEADASFIMEEEAAEAEAAAAEAAEAAEAVAA
jgi:hypothetical protein